MPIPSNQSKELTDFYRSYLAWLEAGAIPDYKGGEYARDTGLCYNAEVFAMKHGLYVDELTYELCGQFSKAGLSSSWPFNTTRDSYTAECDAQATHLNPARIQWVKDHAQ